MEGYVVFTGGEFTLETDGSSPNESLVKEALYKELLTAVSYPGDNPDDIDLSGELVYEPYLEASKCKFVAQSKLVGLQVGGLRYDYLVRVTAVSVTFLGFGFTVMYSIERLEKKPGEEVLAESCTG